MIDTLLNIIAPHVCVVCGEEKGLLCVNCGKKCISTELECFLCLVPIAGGEMCEACLDHLDITNFTSVGWYKEDLKSAVYGYKFNSKRGGAKAIANLMNKVCKPNKDAVVTYIPTTALHIRQRGYDHAKLLAQSYASSAKLPCYALLARTNNHQQRGGSKLQRIQSIAGTFSASNNLLIKNRHILLIDDVITTGSTIQEAVKVLQSCGATSVEVLVVAKTPLNH